MTVRQNMDAQPDTAPPEAEILARIEARLLVLYGEERSVDLARRVRRLLATHRQLRKGRFVPLPLWTHKDVVLISYGNTVQSPTQPPLQTLHSFLIEHLADQFSMLHLLPIFPYSSDDGFSITDFRSVDPELGDWSDVQALSEDFDLVLDLVLNHCSRENLWFIDFIAGEEPACNYFIEMDPAENLSLVTRPRSSPLLSGVRTHSGLKYVWTTFSNDQIDMDYSNPDVLLEFLDLLLYYVRRGARMVRLDAVGFLWKEVGTACIHLPQTHEVVKLIRDLMAVVEPGGLVMTETNVPHAENISYFGDGDEAHLVYQFSLPPLLLQAVQAGTTRHLTRWARSLAQTPLAPGCTYLNFTASHDGVGLRPLEGLVPPEEVQSLLEAMRERGGYISTRRGSDGLDTPYELNISYFDAFRCPGTGKGQWHIPAFLVTQVLALSLQGIPAMYFHLLTATPNDITGVERTGMTRAINRRKWDRAELEGLIASHESETGRVFRACKRILHIRRRQVAFHPEAPQRVLELDDGLFGLERTALDDSQRILVLCNFTAVRRRIPWPQLPGDTRQRAELLHESDLQYEQDGLYLPPFAACWFSDV